MVDGGLQGDADSDGDPAIAKSDKMDKLTDKPTKRSQAGLETAYMAFITTHLPDMFTTYKNVDETKKTKRRLVEKNLWCDFIRYMNRRCRFSQPGLDHANVIRVMFNVAEILRKVDDNEGFAEVLFQCCKLAVPTTDGTPFLLRSVAEVNARMAGLTCEMRESKLFKLAEKPVVRKVVVKKPDVEAKSGKEGRVKAEKGAGRGRKPPKQAGAPVFQTVGSRERPVTVLDDLVNTVEFALRNVKPEDLNVKSMRQA